MSIVLAILLVFPILLYWLDMRWTLSVLQVGAFSSVFFATRRISHPVLWTLLAPGFIAAVQLVSGSTIYAYPTWEALLTSVTNAALFWVSLQILSHRVRQPFLQGLALFAAAMAVVATLQLFTADGLVYWLFPVEYRDSLMGPFLNRNQYAAWIELLFPISLLCALRDHQRRLLWAGAAAAMYASVIASASRAGAALVTIELITVLVLAYRREFLDRRTFVVVVSTLAAFTIVFTALVGWDRLQTRLERRDVFETRRDLTSATLEMIQARPLLGYGLGNWATAYPAHASVDDGRYANQAHNDWLQSFAEGGILNLLALAAFALLIFRPAISSIWGVGILAFLLHGLVDYPLQKPILTAWMSVLAGALAASETQTTPGTWCPSPN